MVADVLDYKRFKVSGLRPPNSEIYSKTGQGRPGEDGPGQYRDVLASKSVKLPTHAENRKFKIQISEILWKIEKLKIRKVAKLPARFHLTRGGLLSGHFHGGAFYSHCEVSYFSAT